MCWRVTFVREYELLFFGQSLDALVGILSVFASASIARQRCCRACVYFRHDLSLEGAACFAHSLSRVYSDPRRWCCPFCLCCLVQDADAATTESFEWLSQLRFDFDPNAKDPTQALTVRMADARFEYGFEYLGIGERLVQTPLTDR